MAGTDLAISLDMKTTNKTLQAYYTNEMARTMLAMDRANASGDRGTATRLENDLVNLGYDAEKDGAAPTHAQIRKAYTAANK